MPWTCVSFRRCVRTTLFIMCTAPSFDFCQIQLVPATGSSRLIEMCHTCDKHISCEDKQDGFHSQKALLNYNSNHNAARINPTPPRPARTLLFGRIMAGTPAVETGGREVVDVLVDLEVTVGIADKPSEDELLVVGGEDVDAGGGGASVDFEVGGGTSLDVEVGRGTSVGVVGGGGMTLSVTVAPHAEGGVPLGQHPLSVQ